MTVRLFAHCGVDVPYVRQLAAVMPGFERYPERSLVLARRGDVVCVPNPVDQDYLAFLASLGLGPDPEDVVVPPLGPTGNVFEPLCRRILGSPEAFERLVRRVRASGAAEVHPFIASPSHFALASALEGAARVPVRVIGGGVDLVERADRKDCMRDQARALGLPIAEGEVVRLAYPGGRRRRDVAPLRDAVLRYLDHTGQVLVRGAAGVSGSSTFVVDHGTNDLASVLDQITRRADNDVYLVEVMVDAVASPNVQMHIAPETGAITCLGVTDQRWSRPLAHAGNLFPCAASCVDEMIRWSRVFAEWLRDEGYLGVAGFDFVEYREPATGASRVLFAEINPRINGATFPLALLERLAHDRQAAGRPAIGAFVSASIETPARDFAELRARIDPLLYSPECGIGVVPYLSAMLPFGKYLAAVFGPSHGEVVRVLEEVQRASGGAVRAAEAIVS
jgi:hypothetical protein